MFALIKGIADNKTSFYERFLLFFISFLNLFKVQPFLLKARMTYILYLLSFKSKQVMQKIATNGGDEKRRPPSTEKRAVWYTVNIFYWLTSTILQFSICQRRPSCILIHGRHQPGCWSMVNARQAYFHSAFHHAPTNC